jgi:hypothetical protein
LEADAMYACDDHWWALYIKEIRTAFKGNLWTQSVPAGQKYGLNVWPGQSIEGLGRYKIHFGGNSGHQAINLAFLLGAHKIILLGFDMQRTNDQSHFFGDHPYHRHGQGAQPSQFTRWIVNMEGIARDLEFEGVQVINASRQTALRCFPTKELSLC